MDKMERWKNVNKRFASISLNELKQMLVGKKVLIKDDLKAIHFEFGYNVDMVHKQGGIITIGEIREYYSPIIGTMYFFRSKEIGYSWDFNSIEAFIDDNIEVTPKKLDKELTIKPGDLVKILQNKIDDSKPLGLLYGIPIIADKEKYQTKLYDKEFVVADIVDDVIYPYFFEEEYQNIVITKDMVELVQEDYVGRVKNKKRQLIKEKKMLSDLEIMKEMKDKVNLKDFTKIYAGSLKTNLKEVKGIGLLLHQWAFNKRHLYKLLGNEFSIKKEIECTKGEEDMKGERKELIMTYPLLYYVLSDITNSEFLSNKLTHDYYACWCDTNYGGVGYYSSGTKVSKIINDACQNDKVNTAYSDIIAQSKIKGIIEISIDPIEILLMSTNTSGWNSCHRINSIGSNRSWGQYSGGIFSYMCDSTSMIAFRHNNKLYDFPIYNCKTQQHSKNWRQMIWINKDFSNFICSRQYPTKMDEITKQVREMLQEQISQYEGKEITWIHSEDESKMKNILKDYRYKNEKSNILHYNDILHGYNGHLCYIKGTPVQDAKIQVGSNPVCPNCGRKILTNHSHPFCGCCEWII